MWMLVCDILNLPETVLILGCINKLSVTCYVWNLMFSMQMGAKKRKKKRKGKGIASFIFHFLRIVKTSFVSFPSVDPAGKSNGNFRNG